MSRDQSARFTIESERPRMRHFRKRLCFVAGAATALISTDIAAEEMRPMMSLEIANMAADACEQYQAENELPTLNIAVVDRGADLVLFRRQNDAFLGSGQIAIDKAISSASIPFPTHHW